MSKCILGLPHKIIYKKGRGYFCRRCEKTALQCQKGGKKG